MPLIPLLPGQCLLVSNTSVLSVGVGRLWMHNLYLRHSAGSGSDPVWQVRHSSNNVDDGAYLYLTSCTLQGHGQYEDGSGASGLFLAGISYVEGGFGSRGQVHRIAAVKRPAVENIKLNIVHGTTVSF